MGKATGCVELIPVSAEHPLSQAVHFVAGIKMPECQVLESSYSFEALYVSLGVAIIASVLDGDCALDVMTMMLGIPPSSSARRDLRIELSDYLIERIGEPWIQDIMVACQELRQEDVSLYRSGNAKILAAPTAPAPAVADPALAAPAVADAVTPDEETFDAMRWASKLEDDSCVLALIRSLPKEVVEEQVSLYRRRDETAVAVTAKAQGPKPKVSLGANARFQTRMLVAQRFHTYCRTHGIVTESRLPYGAMKTFIKENIEWKGKQKVVATCQIKKWYDTWRKSGSNLLAADAGDASKQLSNPKNMLKSRAPMGQSARRRAPGAGRQFKAHCVREALYEWWSGIRYAIDWKQLIAENRSRGRKHLARFPRSILRLKVQQLLRDHAYACLLNGVPVASFKADSHWCRRWEEDYGLSMRRGRR